MGFCKATPSESSALISVSRIKAQQRENPQKESRCKYGLKLKKKMAESWLSKTPS